MRPCSASGRNLNIKIISRVLCIRALAQWWPNVLDATPSPSSPAIATLSNPSRILRAAIKLRPPAVTSQFGYGMLKQEYVFTSYLATLNLYQESCIRHKEIWLLP